MNDKYELPQYSRSKIEKAGKVISRFDDSSPEFNEFLPVVDNWRAAHAYALDNISEIVSELLKEDENSFVVHRLKRLDSIIGKLKRTENTGLFRMQDLGGCRVIVDNLDKVYKTVNNVKQRLVELGHTIHKEYDYISIPREISGYRSYHIVVKFHCKEEPLYEGLFVEIQIRTKLEHIWATAVEMMDIITEETLKAGTGKIEYMRFFKLASALFSINEGTAIVEGVVSDEEKIVDEIYKIDRTEQIRDKLAAYNQAIEIVNTKRKDSGTNFDDIGYYLLVVHKLEHRIRIIPFSKKNIERATRMYQDLEREKKKKGQDIVLISVNSLDNIKDAYPNYFLMTFDFLNRLDYLCSKYPEKPSIPFTTQNNGICVTDLFNSSVMASNIPESIVVSPDTIGAKSGDIRVIPALYNMTLDGSYLRFSAPIWDEERHLTKDQEDDREYVIIPHEVIGPGIVITRNGGCFFNDEPHWTYICEDDSLLVQSKDNSNSNIKLLLAWLKSNLLAWDLLWNYHARSCFSEKIFNKIYLPTLSDNDSNTIVSMVDRIIELEYSFVETYTNETSLITDEEITKFNNSVASLLSKMEAIYTNHFNVSNNDFSVIQQELSIKGYYTY